MKKTFKYLIILLLLAFIPSASALTYNNIRISAVFTGGQESKNVESIEVNYYTLVDNVKTRGKVTLLRSENFSTLFPTTPVDTIQFDYAIAVTRDGVKDIYGFITYEPEVSEDPVGDYVDLSLLLIYNNKGFDGEKYRANTEITDDELNSIRSGGTNRNHVVINNNSNLGETPKVVTTTKPVETTTENQAEKRQKIIQDNQQKREEEKEERQKQSLSLLTIILIIIGVVVVIIIITILVKMRQASNRV